ncbi:MAG: antitoxin family protein, partial [Candidatus Freyarchaeota archaeon]
MRERVFKPLKRVRLRDGELLKIEIKETKRVTNSTMLNLFVRYLLFGCVLLPEHPTDGRGGFRQGDDAS